MFLYICLTALMFVILLLGLRKDSKDEAECWPQAPKKQIARNNYTIAKTISIVSLTLLWFLTAFRSINIGNDTKIYVDYFYTFSKGIDLTRSFEIGYQILNFCIGKITNDPHVFIIIIATLMYVGVAYYIYKYSKNKCISLCLFFCYFFSIFTSIFRQGIAMIIVLYGYQYLKENKKIKAILLFALATTFHTTAILSFLLLLKNNLSKNRWLIISLTILCIILSSTGILNTAIMTIIPRYSHYFESRYASTGWLSVTFSLIINYAWFIIIEKSINKDNEKDKLVATNFALLLITTALGYSVNLFTRAGEYFLLIALTEIPNTIYREKIKNYKLWLFIICSILLTMFILTLIFRPGWNHLYPYEFWSYV